MTHPEEELPIEILEDEEVDLDGNEKPDDDRRHVPREAAKFSVKFSGDADFAKAYRAYTRNIGLGGLCLATRKPYQRGEHIHLVLEVGEGEPLELFGVVAWAKENIAVGVQFQNLTDGQRARLEVLLRQAGLK